MIESYGKRRTGSVLRILVLSVFLNGLVSADLAWAQSNQRAPLEPIQFEGSNPAIGRFAQQVNAALVGCYRGRPMAASTASEIIRQSSRLSRGLGFLSPEMDTLRDVIDNIWIAQYMCVERGRQ
ncbi:MAG: hypothetical protein AAF197_08670 [Pseudomonadota bacterium]